MTMERFVIQSSIKEIAKVEKYISDLCDEKNAFNYFATISVAVMQAVENAITHGNKSDVEKIVIIESGDYCGGIYFEIEDQGEGFDVAQYGDLSIEGTKGDGIFMMRMLSDRLEYSNGGRKVRMEFAIRGIDATQAVERANTLQKYFMTKQVEA